ncbi:MAG: hypothetical protein LH624_08395, partial [Cryobacterium sp.]|nr:hypothetical protein [Cryobacterium sp.]
MVAESVLKHRPALPEAVRGLWSRTKTPFGAVLIGLLAGVLPVAAAGLPASATAYPTAPAATEAFTAAATNAVNLRVAPGSNSRDKRYERMSRVLKASGIREFVWDKSDLPDIHSAKHQLA